MSEYENEYYAEPEEQHYDEEHYETEEQHYEPEEEHDPLTDSELERKDEDSEDEREDEDLSETDDEMDAEPAGEKKQVQFSNIGQPIGPSSAKFVTFVGSMARTHCRPTYVKWSIVPPKAKRHVWRTVSDAYELDYSCKVGVLRKANIAWKNWKSKLRSSYDMYSTDAERRANVPKDVKEDWEQFVQICSTPEEQLKREKGRSSRMQMKLPHTSGRRGLARTLEDLKKQSPDGKVTRTQLFVAIHTKRDGSCPFPDARRTLDEITRLVTLKPYLAHRDLDYDAVALTCHRPRKGRVLGYGDTVSKTVINAATPYKEMAEREKRKREDTETDFSLLMQCLDEETKARKILEEKLAHLEELSAANNQAGQCSTTPAVETHAFPQSTRCLVKSFRKIPIAFGSIRTNVTSEDDSYQIRISEIYDRNAELYEGETFADIRIGSMIIWPKNSVQLM